MICKINIIYIYFFSNNRKIDNNPNIGSNCSNGSISVKSDSPQKNNNLTEIIYNKIIKYILRKV